MSDLAINNVKLTVTTAELKAALQTTVSILNALSVVVPAGGAQVVDQALIDALTYTSTNDILLGMLSALLAKV